MAEIERDAQPCLPPTFGTPHREPVNRNAWVRIGGRWRRAQVSRWWRHNDGLVVHLAYEEGDTQRAGYFIYDLAAVRPSSCSPAAESSYNDVANTSKDFADAAQRKLT